MNNKDKIKYYENHVDLSKIPKDIIIMVHNELMNRGLPENQIMRTTNITKVTKNKLLNHIKKQNYSMDEFNNLTIQYYEEKKMNSKKYKNKYFNIEIVKNEVNYENDENNKKNKLDIIEFYKQISINQKNIEKYKIIDQLIFDIDNKYQKIINIHKKIKNNIKITKNIANNKKCKK